MFTKSIPLLILFLFFFSFTFSQKINIDSLEHLLDVSQSDTSKIRILNFLCAEYCSNDAKKSLEYAKQSVAIAEKVNVSKYLAKSYYHIGLAFDYLSQLDTALFYYTKAFDISSGLADRESMARYKNAIGNIYIYKGNYPQGLKECFASLKIAEELGDKKIILIPQNNIGNVYYFQGEIDKALENWQVALNLMKETGDEKYITVTLSNIGVAYGHLEQYDEGLKYHQEALKHHEKRNDKYGMANTLSNIGFLHLQKKNYPEGLKYSLSALKISREIDDRLGICIRLTNIGDVYYKGGNYEKSLPYYTEALDIAVRNKQFEYQKTCYMGLFKNYEAKGDYKKAFEYHEKFSDVKDSLFNEQGSKQITEMQTKYETEKKEQQIILLNKDMELQDAQLNRQKIIIWSVAGGLLMVIILAVIIFRSLSITRKQKKIIEKEKQRSEELLLNILPAETAEELKSMGKAESKQFNLVTVLFTDFKGFTAIAEKMKAAELVSELDYCFRKFDEIIGRYTIEKIKTIGDSYMCAGGLPVPNETNPLDVVNAGLDIQKFMEEYKLQREKEGKLFFEVRIGIHTGPIVAGIVGIKKFAYDIWGDTVNTASRMESSGEIGKVNISGVTHEVLKNNTNLKFTFRGKFSAKNKGEIEMYFVARQ